MGIGGGGLEALATYNLTTAVQKTQQSTSSNQDKEALDKIVSTVDDSQTNVKPEELIKVVDKLNKTTEIYNKGLRFKVHDETDRLIVQVVDEKSGDVIKQIPPEDILDLEASIEEMVGLIIDKKV